MSKGQTLERDLLPVTPSPPPPPKKGLFGLLFNLAQLTLLNDGLHGVN